jgi:hypothetical protein
VLADRVRAVKEQNAKAKAVAILRGKTADMKQRRAYAEGMGRGRDTQAKLKAFAGLRDMTADMKARREEAERRGAEKDAEKKEEVLGELKKGLERRKAFKKQIAEVRAEKKEEYEYTKEEAKKIPNTKFFYSTIKIAGKTHLQINHDELGLLDGKVDKLPLMERALTEAEEEEQTEKVKKLITKLKQLIASTRHKERKVLKTARTYAERKRAEKEASPRAEAGGGGVGVIGGNVHGFVGGGAGGGKAGGK